MADKQVNININYKVNTVEVQKAEQLLKQAQTASNTFEQSAKKAGTTTSTAFKQAGTSIQDMNARLAVLKERITQSSDPAKIKRLSDQYKQLKTQIDAANKAAFETSKAVDQAGKSTQSLTGQLGGLYNAVKLAFTAGIIKEVVTTTLEMAKLSGTVEGVERAFYRLPQAKLLIQDLRSATKGTVTDLELMQKALTATNFKIPLEQLGTLLEFATVRAQQTGQEVNHLVDYIVTGIGLRSIKRLDDLGFTANRVKEALGGVSLQAASMAQVMQALGKLMNEDLQKTGGYAETAATKVEQLNVAWEELRVTVSQRITSSSLIGYFIDGLKGADKIIRALDASAQQTLINLKLLFKQEEVEKQAFKQAKPIIQRIGLLEEELRLTELIKEQANVNDTINNYNNVITANKNRIGILKVEIESLKERNKSIVGAQKLGTEESKLIKIKEDEIVSIEKTTDAYKLNKEILGQVKLLLSDYEKSLSGVNDEGIDTLGIIKKLKQDIEDFGKKIDDATSFEDIRRLNDELKILQATLTDLQNSTNQFNPLASQVFDIKQNLGKIKLKPGDVMDTQSLEADTAQLFFNLGKKAGEEFKLGTASGITNLERVFMAAKDDLEVAAIDLAANSLMELQSMEIDSYNTRINNLTRFYDRQQVLSGDNEKAKDEMRLREMDQVDALRKKQAEKEKRAAMFNIIINTAASIAKTAATLGFPAAIPAIIVAAATGAAQLALVSQRSTGFKDGVLNLNGPGTGRSDSIPAKLSKGESVMTAQEWKTSKGVLKEVRAKKLDDKVLSDLKLGKDGVTYMGGFNDKKLLSKLDEVKNSFPDIEARGNLLYTTKKKSDNYRQWVRKSSMSS